MAEALGIIIALLWAVAIFCTLPVALRVPWLGRKIAVLNAHAMLKEAELNDKLRVRD